MQYRGGMGRMDWNGLDISEAGVRYRAPYGANKKLLNLIEDWLRIPISWKLQSERFEMEVLCKARFEFCEADDFSSAKRI